MLDSNSDIPSSNAILNKPKRGNLNGNGPKNHDLKKKPSKKSAKGKTAAVKKRKVSSEKKSTRSLTRGHNTTRKNQNKRTKVDNNSDIDEYSRDIGKLFREGQKYITPPNGDATRAFYESLYEENPYSIIALKYCVENGILLGNKHVIAYERLEFLREKGFLKRAIGGLQKEAIEQLRLFDSKRCGFPGG